MDFSFNNTAGASQNTNKTLEFGEIHKVAFQGCEIIDGQWGPVFEIKFKSPEGELTHKIFEPKKDGLINAWERKTGETNGKPWTLPAPVETYQLLLKHLLDEIAPDFAKRIDNGEKMEFRTWNELCKIVIKETSPFIGKETQIKVMPNNKGFSELGVGYMIDRNTDKAKIVDNGIGKNLKFSPYDLTKINKAKENIKNAKDFKATKVSNLSNDNFLEDKKSDSNDIDLEFELEGL